MTNPFEIIDKQSELIEELARSLHNLQMMYRKTDELLAAGLEKSPMWDKSLTYAQATVALNHVKELSCWAVEQARAAALAGRN